MQDGKKERRKKKKKSPKKFDFACCRHIDPLEPYKLLTSTRVQGFKGSSSSFVKLEYIGYYILEVEKMGVQEEGSAGISRKRRRRRISECNELIIHNSHVGSH
jgi:hypothetical protein